MYCAIHGHALRHGPPELYSYTALYTIQLYSAIHYTTSTTPLWAWRSLSLIGNNWVWVSGHGACALPLRLRVSLLLTLLFLPVNFCLHVSLYACGRLCTVETPVERHETVLSVRARTKIKKTGTLPNSADRARPSPRPPPRTSLREPTATRHSSLFDTRTSQKRYAPACCFTGCLYPTTLTPSPPWRSGSTTLLKGLWTCGALLNPGVIVARLPRPGLASRQAHGAGARGAPRLVSSK